jgi:hypothetical protein
VAASTTVRWLRNCDFETVDQLGKIVALEQRIARGRRQAQSVEALILEL